MEVDFDTREGIMKEWDKWIVYYKSGGGGSWPRDAFESLLDYFDEKLRVSQPADSADECTCDAPDNDAAPYGNYCLACGGIIRR